MPDDLLADADAIAAAIRQMAVSIADVASKNGATKSGDVALVGIRRGGVPIARMLAHQIEELIGHEVPLGTVDIALYRDDAATVLPDPKIGPSFIEFDVAGRDVVLVDDVLQTGRTVRAAIDCLLDYGRPRRVWLAVLFDRGGRELPIAADFVGRDVQLAVGGKLEVMTDDKGAPVAARVRESAS